MMHLLDSSQFLHTLAAYRTASNPMLVPLPAAINGRITAPEQ